MLGEEILQHVAVLFDAVGPEVLAHQRHVGMQALIHERHRDLAGRRFAQVLQTLVLGLGKRLQHRAGQPRVRIGDAAAHADDVHDREYLAALVIGHRLDHRVVEQPADIGRASGQVRCARGDVAVDFAFGQQLRNRLAGGRVDQADALRQVQLDLFGPVRIGNAAAHPGDVFRRDAVILFQERADPDHRGQLVFGQANLLALQVFGPLDPVLADIERRMAEHPRQERGHADIGQRAVGRLHGGGRQRELANVKLGLPERAEEDFLWREAHEHRVDPVDLHVPIEQRTAAVVIADRDGQLQLAHFRTLLSA